MPSALAAGIDSEESRIKRSSCRRCSQFQSQLAGSEQTASSRKRFTSRIGLSAADAFPAVLIFRFVGVHSRQSMWRVGPLLSLDAPAFRVPVEVLPYASERNNAPLALNVSLNLFGALPFSSEVPLY